MSDPSVKVEKVAKDKKYDFDIMTPQGPAKISVPHAVMKVCPCGSILFHETFMVAFMKPQGILNAPANAFRVSSVVCVKCGREVNEHDKTVMEVEKEKSQMNGKVEHAPEEKKSSIIIEP